jgi:UDP-N-acetylglucosamine diphosphorylase/glucosamine-1-phosphate N-acetyltransferase
VKQVRSLVVFEDATLQAFATVTALRAVYDLRCGGRTLLERQIQAVQPDHVVLLGRPELQALQRETHPQAEVGVFRRASAADDSEVWFVNGRLLLLGADLDRLRVELPRFCIVLDGDALLLARCNPMDAPRLADFLQASLQTHTSRTLMSSGGLESWLRTEFANVPILQAASQLPALTDGSGLIEHIWELVSRTPVAIADDFRLATIPARGEAVSIHASVHLLEEANIRVGAHCQIAPAVVLDASQGPILLDEGVRIQPHSFLQGPLYVGPGSLIKAGSKIHEGSALGPQCKVGGEIEASVLQGFSNKQHEGFLGHAYLAEWVNLGADTNNSDLKNNYSTVRVWESGQYVDTGQMFVGLIAADHVKSAINTQFNTGTVVGLASQVFGAGFPPKYVPPFTWGGIGNMETYAYDKALATARIVMQRRNRQLTPGYEDAFQLVWGRSRNDVQSD